MRRTVRWRPRRGAALLVMGLCLGGCAGERAAPSASELTLAVRGDVTGIFPNPPIQNESYTLDVNANVFEGLVRLDRALAAEPALAERWENPDERTFVFTLKKDLRFSNGEPVLATDVAASLSAARDRPFITRDTLQAVASVRALDRERVEVRTHTPYPVLLNHLPRGFILPAKALGQRPVPPVGTGPYMVDQWLPGESLRLVRNPNFRGPRPAYERATFLVRPDPVERMGLLVSGRVQLADNVPLDEIDRLHALAELQVISRPGLRVLFLAFDVTRPPFDDPRVREAVDLAIDREDLIRRALFGKAVPASQLVPPAVAGYDASIAVPHPDRERARALLAQAGHAGGLQVRLDGPNNRYVGDAEILREVARQLAAVGVTVKVNAIPKHEFFPLVTRHESRFFLLGWACETGDAGDALDALVHSASGSFGAQNYGGLADAELDRLIDASNGSPLPSERVALLGRALRRVAELRPVLPIEVQTEAVALSRGIRWDVPANLALRVAEMAPARR